MRGDNLLIIISWSCILVALFDSIYIVQLIDIIVLFLLVFVRLCPTTQTQYSCECLHFSFHRFTPDWGLYFRRWFIKIYVFHWNHFSLFLELFTFNIFSVCHIKMNVQVTIGRWEWVLVFGRTWQVFKLSFGYLIPNKFSKKLNVSNLTSFLVWALNVGFTTSTRSFRWYLFVLLVYRL